MELVLEKLGLKRSTYYYLRSHPREDAYADVRPLVREIFSRTPNGMGYRQVRMALRAEQGLSISGKTVLRLMWQHLFGRSGQRLRPASLNPTGVM